MKEYPFIKLSISFALGIFFNNYFDVNLTFLFINLIVAFFILILAYKKQYSFSFKLYVLNIFFFLLGSVAIKNANSQNIQYPFEKYKIKDALIYGEIVNINLLRENKVVFEIKSDSIIYNENKIKNNYKILCNIIDLDKNLKKIYNKIQIGNKVKLKSIIIKPRDQRNPFEFNYEKYLNDKGISFIANLYKANDILIIKDDLNELSNFIFSVRKNIDEKLKTIYNNSTYNLLRGLILADRSEIDQQISDDFINVGVIHVLAVSGLHVGFVVVIFLFLFSRFNVYLRTVFTIIGLIFFMLLTGSGAPVVRATFMVSIFLILPLIGRSSNGLNSLSFAAFVILLINPKDLFNPSFQLSFSAILSLIVIAPKINSYLSKFSLNKFVKYVVLFFGTTLSAQLGTIPFTLAYFNKLSLVSFIANLFVIPLVGLIVGLGITSILFSFISNIITSYYASLNELLTYFIFNFVHILSKFKLSSIGIKYFSFYDGLIYYIMFGVILSFIKYFNSNIKKIIFIVFVVLLFFIYEQFDNYDLLPKNRLSVLAIDIGQGDSFLVKFPNEKVALIDAGNADKNFDNGKQIILPLLNKLGISKIDYAFISHVDADHYMGFISLIKNFPIEKIYKPTLNIEESKDYNLESLIKSKKIPIVYYNKEKIQIGNSVLYILNEKVIEKEAKSVNDKSGLFKLVYGKNSLLFTGDLGVKMERKYVDYYNNFLQSDVLKAGHHGSKTSSSENFIKKVKPKIALISAGIENKFKHPSNEIVERFIQNNVKILRTDLMGAILLKFDGEKIHLINWKN